MISTDGRIAHFYRFGGFPSRASNFENICNTLSAPGKPVRPLGGWPNGGRKCRPEQVQEGVQHDEGARRRFFDLARWVRRRTGAKPKRSLGQTRERAASVVLPYPQL